MQSQDKTEIKQRKKNYHFLEYAFLGIEKVIRNPFTLFIMLVILTVEVRYIAEIFKSLGELESFVFLTSFIKIFAITVVIILTNLIVLFFVGKPLKANSAGINLICGGFTNYVGEAPYLLKSQRDPENKKVRIYTFSSSGIPLEKWVERKSSIEAALNITTLSIEYEQGKKYIVIRCVNAKGDFPKKVRWSDKYLSKKDFELTVGVGADDIPVHIDLNVIPMVLIGGSTGSGKTVLLKSLIKQAKMKGAQIFIADFKGGVDFGDEWSSEAQISYCSADLIIMLDTILNELAARRDLLIEYGSPNISDFNEHHPDMAIPRIIFACDEVAELLDTKGLTKEEKEAVNKITADLSTIARQGRAFGIHLILATQRPDATVLSGQIRSNLQCRICGFADNNLSELIMDTAEAAKRIPHGIPGRFVLNDENNTLFQAFL